MKLNKAGIDLIKQFEGLSLTAYPDPATGGEPFTIGYGHTGGVKPKDVITMQMAEGYLIQDLKKFCDGVTKLLNDKVIDKITDNSFSAMVSLAYNIGLGNFSKSTLLRRVNESKFMLAASEFERWSRANGKVMAGLMRRRRAERDLFVSGLHS